MMLATAIIAATFALAVATPAVAQQSSGTPPEQSPAASAPTGADTGVRPPTPRKRRPQLFDVIKAVVPPLIDAATRPPAPARPPADPPAPVPATPVPVAKPAAAPAPIAAPVPAPAPPVITPRPAPVPRQANNQPKPPFPRSVEVPVVQAPVAPSITPPPAIQPAEPVPARTEPSPLPVTPPALAPVPPGEVSVPLHAGQTAWANPILLGLLLATVLTGAALVQMRRRLQIARTRGLLSLMPRLDPVAGDGHMGQLSIAGPHLAIRARLLPDPAHV